jgi:hypothetical protein
VLLFLELKASSSHGDSGRVKGQSLVALGGTQHAFCLTLLTNLTVKLKSNTFCLVENL